MTKISKRLLFLGERFNIFEKNDIGRFIDSDETKYDKLMSKLNDGEVLAIKESKLVNPIKKRYKYKIHISDDVFGMMVNADPTTNKEYLQWMLTVFTNLYKSPDILDEKARQFAEEDLKLANNYLKVFITNKRKKRFKQLAKNTFSDPNSDPTNINQYNSLSELFDVVDPFIERDTSTLEKGMLKFQELGEAEIVFKDRKWTIYTPLTKEASCIMENFASWCTAQPNQGMFNSYTKNYTRPDGSDSKLFIIVNNDLFKGKSNECYQIHFETNQFKSKENSSNVDIYDLVLSKNKGIFNYFKNYLFALVKAEINPSASKYVDILINLGYCDILFDIFGDDTPIIKIMSKKVPYLPDLGRFKNLTQLIVTESNLSDLGYELGKLHNLELLSLPKNSIKHIPDNISNLKKVNLINLRGNRIENIPDTIKDLDPSNGGSLYRLSIDNISPDNSKKLERLLPNVLLSIN